MRFLIVGLGGIFGALARYGVGLIFNNQSLMPWGTWTVNVAGCFLLSLFITLVMHKFGGQAYFVLAIATGFIGSFTTFSTLSMESVMLFQISVGLGMLYLAITIIGGIFFTYMGYALGQYILTTGWGKRWFGFAVGGKNSD